jgi:long-chain acyl-CoA synthetase
MQVAAVHLTPEPFSVDNGLLTPSFKLKRPQAKAAFEHDIAALYRRLDGVPA